MLCPHCGRDAPAGDFCSLCGQSLAVGRIEVLSGPGQGTVRAFGPRPFDVGRAEENDLVLPDPSVSRKHARLSYDAGTFHVEDLGSRLGLKVDGARVRRSPLVPGTRIEVGEAVLRFRVETAPAGHEHPLLAVLEALGSTLVVDEVLERVLDAGLRILGAERGFVLLQDPSGEGSEAVPGYTVRASRGQGPGPDEAPEGISRSVLERALAGEQTVASSDAAQDPELAALDTVARRALRTVVCVPLRSPRPGPGPGAPRPLGALYFDNQAAASRFGDDALGAAEALARHAALALENARLFESEQRTVEQLRLARDQAMEASLAKSLFLGNMSHELHTPLNAIIGYAEILREKAEEAGREEDLPDVDKIVEAGRELLRIVDDVLDVSRLEEGKVRLAPVPVDLGVLVRDLAEAAGALAARAGDRFEVRVPEAPGTVLADPQRLRQVLWNLLSNAAKFTEGGLVRLELRRQEEGGRSWVAFEVSDTGIGIAPEQAESIFEPFTQGDESSTRRHGGAGLGLAVSRRLAQAMGGELLVESEPGRGSRFTFRLPAGG